MRTRDWLPILLFVYTFAGALAGAALWMLLVFVLTFDLHHFGFDSLTAALSIGFAIWFWALIPAVVSAFALCVLMALIRPLRDSQLLRALMAAIIALAVTTVYIETIFLDGPAASVRSLLDYSGGGLIAAISAAIIAYLLPGKKFDSLFNHPSERTRL
jgi:hypothetical protein